MGGAHAIAGGHHEREAIADGHALFGLEKLLHDRGIDVVATIQGRIEV